jgi:hypothetical protein
MPMDLEALPKAAGPGEPKRARVMLANHERANNFVLSAVECDVQGGQFQAALAVPDKLPWPRLILRAYAANKQSEGLAVRTLEVRKK